MMDDQVTLKAAELMRDGPGVLVLYGEPGIGKFQAARAVAARVLAGHHENGRAGQDGQLLELRMNSWEAGGARYNLLELLRELDAQPSRPWDLSDAELRELYRLATEHVPVVLLLDEIDRWHGSGTDYLLPAGRASLVIASCAAELSRRELAESGLDPAQVHQARVTGPGADWSRGEFAKVARPGPVVPQRPERMDELVELCHDRPLAVKLAAGLYAHHETWTARQVVDLARLSPSEDVTDITQQLLDRVYDRLPGDERHLFDLLALSTRATVAGASGVTAQSLRERPGEPPRLSVDEGLRSLARRGLLEPLDTDSYRLSPSVQRFVLDRRKQHEPADPAEQNLAEAFRRFMATIPELPRMPLENGSIEQLLARADRLGPLDARETCALAADLCDHLVQQRASLVLAMLHYVVQQFARDVRRLLELPVHGALGVLDRKSGHLSHARHRLLWVRERYAELGYTLLEARTLRQIGVACYHAGELRTAACYLRRADDLAVAHGHERERPWVLRVLGAVYNDMGRLDEAKRVLGESVDLHERAGNALGAAWARAFLATSLLLSHRTDEAHVELAQARGVFDRELPKIHFAHAWADLVEGREMWQSGSHDQAVELLRESRNRSMELNEPLGEGWAALELGRRERERGRLLDARTVLHGAQGNFRGMDNRLGLAWVAYELALLPTDMTSCQTLLEKAAAEFDMCGEARGLTLARRQLERLVRGERLDPDDDGTPFPDPGPTAGCYLTVRRVPPVVHQGTTVRVGVYLDLAVQEALRASRHGVCRVVAVAPRATVEPTARLLDPHDRHWPVRLEFTVRRAEPGPQELRFLVLNEAAGTLLQDIEARLDMH
ncbi:tetratricopeptide repeat protein [Streptomyces sp. Q6]|uniref:Tetratricopeptide repeat protein n=1 Tax=Streptomyces citrinus TaxID=3118173 RepID=A0ACD5A9V1_9ACTN